MTVTTEMGARGGRLLDRQQLIVEKRAAILRQSDRGRTGTGQQGLTGLNQMTGTAGRGEEGGAILGLGDAGAGSAWDGRQVQKDRGRTKDSWDPTREGERSQGGRRGGVAKKRSGC